MKTYRIQVSNTVTTAFYVKGESEEEARAYAELLMQEEAHEVIRDYLDDEGSEIEEVQEQKHEWMSEEAEANADKNMEELATLQEND